MTLAAEQASFIEDLRELWDKPKPTTTILQTGDLLEAYWSNALVSGVSSAVTVVSGSTYPGLSPLLTPFGAPPIAAAAFEAALLAMVQATLFTPIPPAIITPPYVPVGPSAPGILTAALIPIFSVPSPASVVSIVGGLFAGYLQSWTAPVTIPPSGPVPTPIV